MTRDYSMVQLKYFRTLSSDACMELWNDTPRYRVLVRKSDDPMPELLVHTDDRGEAETEFQQAMAKLSRAALL
jgi:hypothetical protein